MVLAFCLLGVLGGIIGLYVCRYTLYMEFSYVVLSLLGVTFLVRRLVMCAERYANTTCTRSRPSALSLPIDVSDKPPVACRSESDGEAGLQASISRKKGKNNSRSQRSTPVLSSPGCPSRRPRWNSSGTPSEVAETLPSPSLRMNSSTTTAATVSSVNEIEEGEGAARTKSRPEEASVEESEEEDARMTTKRLKEGEDRRKNLRELLGQQSHAAHRLRGTIDNITAASMRVQTMQAVLDESLTAAQDGASRVSASVRDMLEEFQLQKRRPTWVVVANKLRTSGERMTTKDANSVGLAQLLIHALESGESQHPAHAACVLLRHVEMYQKGAHAQEALRVVASTPGAVQQLQRAKPGAVWQASSNNAVSIDAHIVLRSGEPFLRSRFGLSADAVSLVPLKGRGGATIGVVCKSPFPAHRLSLLFGLHTCHVVRSLQTYFPLKLCTLQTRSFKWRAQTPCYPSP